MLLVGIPSTTSTSRYILVILVVIPVLLSFTCVCGGPYHGKGGSKKLESSRNVMRLRETNKYIHLIIYVYIYIYI